MKFVYQTFGKTFVIGLGMGNGTVGLPWERKGKIKGILTGTRGGERTVFP